MENRIIQQDEFFTNRDLTYAYDSLTHVLNRETTFMYIDNLLERKVPFSMVICDLDNFKYVNDTYGHMIGDKVLCKCSANFMRITQDYGIVGRFGGDEFIIVAPNVVDYDDIWKKCREISFSTTDLKIDELHGSNITLTSGLSRYPGDGEDIKTLMEKADKALYRGKQKGRNCFIIYLHEKHANIEIGDSGKVQFNSMDMHYRVINTLTHSEDLAENVRSLMHFLSSTLMIDHICIQTSKKICCSVVYPLSPVKTFSVIPEPFLDGWTNANGLCCINQVSCLAEHRQDELYNALLQQQIGGGVFTSIDAYGKNYGYLRADSARDVGRIWQNSDIDLLVVFAKTLAILLHYNNTDLDTIF